MKRMALSIMMKMFKTHKILTKSRGKKVSILLRMELCIKAIGLEDIVMASVSRHGQMALAMKENG